MIFIADFIACSTCFGPHYAHHQELESIIQMVAACDIWCFGFQVVGMMWSWWLCVRFAGCWSSSPQTGNTTRGFESHPGHVCLSVVSVVCCQVEVSATDWSLVQRSPTDCGASLYVIKKPRTRGSYSPIEGCKIQPTMGCSASRRKLYLS